MILPPAAPEARVIDYSKNRIAPSVMQRVTDSHFRRCRRYNQQLRWSFRSGDPPARCMLKP